MAKYGYTDIIGDVVSTEGTILGSIGGKFLGSNTEKRVQRVLHQDMIGVNLHRPPTVGACGVLPEVKGFLLDKARATSRARNQTVP